MSEDKFLKLLKTFLDVRSDAAILDPLRKAKEDLAVPSSQRKEFRSAKRKMDSPDILTGQLTPEKGVSDVGIEIRRADKKIPGVVSHGYGRTTDPHIHQQRAAHALRQIISAIQKQPKPQLTKSEDIVAGIKIPSELKQHNGVIPRDHKHRELAAKFVTDVWRKNKLEGIRMSNKFLGEDPEKDQYVNIKKSIRPQPAKVDEPRILNRVDVTYPAVVDQPNFINSYKSESIPESSETIDQALTVRKIIQKMTSLKKAKSDENLPWGEKRKARRDRSQAKATGIHHPADKLQPGTSIAGNESRIGLQPEHGMYGIASNKTIAKQSLLRHLSTLNELKQMPKPNLPKSEDLDKAKVEDKYGEYTKKRIRRERKNKPLIEIPVNPSDPILNYDKVGPKKPKEAK